jgi:serine/threonine-protein phosphatase 2B catalytic subunit
MSKADIMKILVNGTSILAKEPNLLFLNDPITIVGDIHGQYFDFLKLLSTAGTIEEEKFLFLGDFVDRGNFSVEVMILVLALKTCYPRRISLLRGNHECRSMTSSFNFRSECLYKYDQEVYEAFISLFEAMPIAAVINGKFLAVHGGISPELKTLDDINKIIRFSEPLKKGIMRLFKK